MAALRSAFAPRVKAQARAAVAAACAATKAPGARGCRGGARTPSARSGAARGTAHGGRRRLRRLAPGWPGRRLCRPRCAERDGSSGQRGQRQARLSALRTTPRASLWAALGAEAFALAFALIKCSSKSAQASTESSKNATNTNSTSTITTTITIIVVRHK